MQGPLLENSNELFILEDQYKDFDDRYCSIVNPETYSLLNSGTLHARLAFLKEEMEQKGIEVAASQIIIRIASKIN